MAAGPEFYASEEKRSYSAVFLLAVGLLLACTVWALWQDSFSRHLWKKIKTDFYRLALTKYEGELDADATRLAGVPEYVKLTSDLEEARRSLKSGAAAAEIEELREQQDAAEIHVQEKDLDVRVVKSEIEEGWYLLEKAEHAGRNADQEHARLDELQKSKALKQEAYDAAVKQRDDIVAAIGNVESREKQLTEALRPFEKDRDAIDAQARSRFVAALRPQGSPYTDHRAGCAPGVRTQQLRAVGRSCRAVHELPRGNRPSRIRGSSESDENTPEPGVLPRQSRGAPFRLYALPWRSGRFDQFGGAGARKSAVLGRPTPGHA